MSLMQWTQLVVSVTSGVAVAAIIAFVRTAWTRRQVPTGLSRLIGRSSYLSMILKMSQNSQIKYLEALVPNLTPATGMKTMESIQTAWEEINNRNNRRGVRIITRESRPCLTAGAELLSKGVETRVGRSLDTDDLSYHIFGGNTYCTVINHRDGDRDRPIRLDGLSPSKPFHSDFVDAWQASVPLESVLAEQVIRDLKPNTGRDKLAEKIRDLRAKYNLDAAAEEAVLRHIAFRHWASVIFITGLPGAGKSLVRRQLAKKLIALRFQVEELTDYTYAFRDFLHAVIQLGEGRGDGFSPEMGGAFRVDSEKCLEPALQSLAKQVRENKVRTPINLVEFARSDMIAALQVFGDEMLSSSQVIHVQASSAVRERRLQARAQRPRIQVINPAINVLVSDDHRLPSTAASSLYLTDDFSRLQTHPNLTSRVHQIKNEDDDPTLARLDDKLDGFVEGIVHPYKALASSVY